MSILERLDELKWHILACAVCFFLFPAMNAFLPEYGAFLHAVSYAANVIVVDITSFLCGYKAFRWYYPIVIAFIYAFVMAFGNVYTPDSVMVSSLYYLIISYIAAFIGKIIGKIRGNY